MSASKTPAKRKKAPPPPASNVQKHFPPPVKACAQCGASFSRKLGEKLADYTRKTFCSTPCRTTNMRARSAVANSSKAAAAVARKAAIVAAPLPPPAQVPAAVREMAARVLARRSLLHFTKKTHPNYSAGWVHEDICRRLERFSQQVSEKKSPRLMLLMPPRHGKSELASIRFPAWHLGHHPEHEVINVGYNLDLPMKFSRKVREMLRDPVYTSMFGDTKLDPESQSVEAWNTTEGGGFTAAGVGGGITGKGAHVLIVDDPLKNMEEADSANKRDSLWDWYMSTAYTRLAPGAGVLVIETWWNDDDLAGRLQAAMRADPEADQFEIIKYPALAEQYEFRNLDTLHIVRVGAPELTAEDLAAEAAQTPVYGLGAAESLADPARYEALRAPGEALHPERYDAVALRRIKANQVPRIWSALYQQNPVPDEGLYFKKEYFKSTPNLPETYGLRVYTAWDFAIGEKQQNDYTVGATIVQDYRDDLYVLEVVRFKADSFTIIEEILNAAARWGRTGVDYLIGVEDGQIWRAIKPMLDKRMAERTQYPAVQTLRPLTDKIARARSLQGRMQQGRVYFPETAAWRNAAEHELLRFPGGAHDDIVDALAWAVNLVVGRPPPVAPKHQAPESWRERLGSLMAISAGSHMTA